MGIDAGDRGSYSCLGCGWAVAEEKDGTINKGFGVKGEF